jgi:chromate reductase, NAD(P)H dehydrogenase (quinone)
MATTVRVLGIVGSLRVASYNAWLLRAATELAPPELAITPSGLAQIPGYNADIGAPDEPAPVAALRVAIRDASALLIASPEYNYGIPGILKNAIDWISRPPRGSPLERKPVAIMGASTGGGGTVRMQLQLRQTLQAVGMYAMPGPEIFVTFCRDKFDGDGHLTDEKTREHLKGFLAAFLAWTRRF